MLIRFLSLFIIFIPAFVLWPQQATTNTSTYIDHAYFRKVAPEDPGTVHLFIKNPTSYPLSVEKIYLNDFEMQMFKTGLLAMMTSDLDKELPDEIIMPNDYAIWYQMVPPIIEPGEVGDLMVKLRRPTKKLISIKAVLDNGKTTGAVLEAIPPNLKFTFIGYDSDKTTAYLYLENTGKDSLSIDKLFCNAVDISDKCFIPQKTIPPGSKVLVIYTPTVKFRSGAYLAFKVTTNNGEAAEAISRVYSYFPIAAFGKDTRKEMYFDEDYFELRYPDNKDFTLSQKQPPFKCYHVFDDPACVDGIKTQLIGTNAKEIIKRAKECYENDPLHPTIIYSCEHIKPYSYFIYGEATDIFSIDPYEIVFHHDRPEKDAYYTRFAKLASEPRPLWTIPEAFTQGERFPTPEEERIVVYSEIGEGSKGIWYFLYDPKIGYPTSPPLDAEIKNINEELQALKNHILISDPFSLAKTEIERVTPYTLLCGDKGIILILVNNDHESRFDAGKPSFIYQPKRNVQVPVDVPSWLKVKQIKEITDQGEKETSYIQNNKQIQITADKLNITRQYLILTERK